MIQKTLTSYKGRTIKPITITDNGSIYSHKGVLVGTGTSDGYPMINVYFTDGSAPKVTQTQSHRLVILAFYGVTTSPVLQAHHINGDRSDNRLSNLAIVDNSSNQLLTRRYNNSISGQELENFLLSNQVLLEMAKIHPTFAYETEQLKSQMPTWRTK